MSGNLDLEQTKKPSEKVSMEGIYRSNAILELSRKKHV